MKLSRNIITTISLLSGLFVAIGCSDDHVFSKPIDAPGVTISSTPATNYVGCSVYQVYGGAEIVCVNSEAFIPNGAAGSQGVAGIPGSSVVAIKLCPNAPNTSYPSSFPEYGLLIAGVLYGVYWDHTNSWLAQLSPGYYSSTSTSAPCSFTVNSDGSVSQ